ncbi:hypothetical protein [Marinobacterium stanieri]|nr:hypothetical protein [Marinobacterium stanieri]
MKSTPVLNTIALRTSSDSDQYLKRVGTRTLLAIPAPLGYSGRISFSEPGGLKDSLIHARKERDRFLGSFAPTDLPRNLVSLPAEDLPEDFANAITTFVNLLDLHSISCSSLLVLGCFKDKALTFRHVQSDLQVARQDILNRFYDLVNNGYVEEYKTSQAPAKQLTTKGMEVLKSVKEVLFHLREWYEDISAPPFTWYQQHWSHGRLGLIPVLLLLLSGMHSAAEIAGVLRTHRSVIFTKLNRLTELGFVCKHTPSVHGEAYPVITALGIQALAGLYRAV